MENNGYDVGENNIGTLDNVPIGMCLMGGGDCVERVGDDMARLMFFSDGIPSQYCKPFKIDQNSVED
ncbi:hypothetical protein HOA55_01920 [archaeon]|jgi:hypothetical protein|nr:hypothetical protein [archaeon]MBT3577575.1 hypothetical protein [archaeon]MBT6820088.1 hypothetical protein [archaeon]MBT7025310.1 hypothetical protein [archaeon]MBT7238385.1 hypothetical protein [archaeon]